MRDLKKSVAALRSDPNCSSPNGTLAGPRTPDDLIEYALAARPCCATGASPDGPALVPDDVRLPVPHMYSA